MISYDQIKTLSRKYKINDVVVAREFVQVLFLSELYKRNFAQNIFFKGGTAIRLLYGGSRFSEDLDFTLTMDLQEFTHLFTQLMNVVVKQYPLEFREKPTITGKSYLLIAKIPFLRSPIYVRLDFSSRETVLKPTQQILKTDYDVVIQNYVYALDKDEILAEKIRAIMTRKKSRDLYDLWILQEKGAQLNKSLIQAKLNYYNIQFSSNSILKRISQFSQSDFAKDLRPFIPLDERDKLENLFEYITTYLNKSFALTQ